jgi:hypothetical protein
VLTLTAVGTDESVAWLPIVNAMIHNDPSARTWALLR